MNQITLLPTIAGIAAIAAVLYIATKEGRLNKNTWMVPAFFFALFSLLSLQTVFVEGLFGFWPEHTRNLWGNQIWYDLLLAVLIGWYFAIPQAKQVGMRVLPWVIVVFVTGSIGLYAFIARLMYLQARQPQGLPE